MKILIVVPDTNMGGITTAATNLANELIRRGDEVHFLDMSNEHLADTKILPDVKRHSLTGVSRLWNLTAQKTQQYNGFKKIVLLTIGVFKKMTIRLGLWYKLVFSKFNKCGEFDAALAFRQCDPCYSFVLDFVPAKKKIGFVHGELTFMNDISTWKKHMTRFDAIAYVSDAVKNQFVSAYPELSDNARTVYNTFDIETIKSFAKEKPDIEFDKAKKNIVTVARIDNQFKQIDWIPYICQKLKQLSNTPFCWYVVGGGPDYDDVARLIEETGTGDVLKLVGQKNNPYSYIAQSDFTILTSKSEAYPMVVIESFILEKPIVSTDFPSAFEMIKAGSQGLIAKQSIDSITQCVLQILDTNILESFNEYFKENTVTNELALNQLLNAINKDEVII